MALPEFKTPRQYKWQLAHERISDEQIGFYLHDLSSGNLTIKVTTSKGIIELEKLATIPAPNNKPGPGFEKFTQIYIDNEALDLSLANRDNIYLQLTPYYSQFPSKDTFIPYLLPNGFVVEGLGVQIYNANPASADINQFTGAFYIYYELRTIK